MERLNENTFVITATQSGRRYVVYRAGLAMFRVRWDVCDAVGGCYGTFATLPGARAWARSH